MLEGPEGRFTRRARKLVNAAGPWAMQVIHDVAGVETPESIRLVRGSHIVVPRLFDHDKCYFFQGDDGRIAFAIPYEQDFTLIGTTDADHAGPDTTPVCSEAEAEYLREFMATYLNRPIAAEDIVWTYSGVRALYEDGASSASAATRDYVLRLNDSAGAPMLNVFGGKITTYRRLAEAAMAKLGAPGGNWTAGVPLPGGEFPVDGVQAQIDKLLERCDFLDAPWAGRLIRTYGTQAAKMLGDAVTVEEMGTDFGAGLTAREVDWLIDREFASTPDDVLWRRSKLGLRLDPDQVAALGAYMAEAAAARAASVTARSSSVSARQG
jgi:glycerol-3-phosphate dehydrogenase